MCHGKGSRAKARYENNSGESQLGHAVNTPQLGGRNGFAARIVSHSFASANVATLDTSASGHLDEGSLI